MATGAAVSHLGLTGTNPRSPSTLASGALPSLDPGISIPVAWTTASTTLPSAIWRSLITRCIPPRVGVRSTSPALGASHIGSRGCSTLPACCSLHGEPPAAHRNTVCRPPPCVDYEGGDSGNTSRTYPPWFALEKRYEGYSPCPSQWDPAPPSTSRTSASMRKKRSTTACSTSLQPSQCGSPPPE
ncbi:uncharacterized protein [Triticum aestivum]|uniref:uncharacterized protein n=1 Tax=Triticum aestivum TaxID=4565 RepID=UPI001D006D35|nr:uncharacterized protein LOC123160975 [Triticum aestivum]